ncbi:MAG TPA: ligase-associated DNA damage response exonuclease [Puia sp.]|jgi:putative mRNA 3-end processing factor
MPLIEFTDRGLYCPQGAFYIDPWRPVDMAVITHAHSDHARPGSGAYLCHTLTLPLLKLRLGDNAYQSVDWNRPVNINGVSVSLHPAGHIIGSSQVRVEYQGEVWVVSGDYKTENDGISGAFEPIRCHTFITESTFGLPIYNWKPQQTIFASIQEWLLKNQAEGKTSVLIAYSLGKAQRLLPAISAVTDRIFLHGAVWNVHQTLVDAGIDLPAVQRVELDAPKEIYKGSVVIAPSGAEQSPWIRRFQPYEVGICSGWMQVRGNVRRRNADAGYALSDHADWKGLLSAIEATGAEKVFVTHGFQAALSRYLNEQGLQAAEVKTEYGEDEEGAPALTEDSSLTEESPLAEHPVLSEGPSMSEDSPRPEESPLSEDSLLSKEKGGIDQ